MNGHERRKAAKVTVLVRDRAAKVAELKSVRVSDISCPCAWKGCTAECNLGEELLSAWSALLLTRSRRAAALLEIRPGECLRDTCLCPEHTRLLDSQLVDLIRWEPMAPAAGSA